MTHAFGASGDRSEDDPRIKRMTSDIIFLEFVHHIITPPPPTCLSVCLSVFIIMPNAHQSDMTIDGRQSIVSSNQRIKIM